MLPVRSSPFLADVVAANVAAPLSKSGCDCPSPVVSMITGDVDSLELSCGASTNATDAAAVVLRDDVR